MSIAGFIAVTAAAWFASGGRLYAIQTGSMVPTINVGDAVLTRPVDPLFINVGDVVSFRDSSQPNLLITHRVVAVYPGTRRLTTQGDHNKQPDSSINADQVIGRVQWRAIGLGTVLSWLRRPIGLIIFVYIPAAIISYRVLLQLMHRRPTYQLRR